MKEILQSASVIDVRTPQEFALGHFPGAINIPLDKLPLQLEEIKALKAPLVAYCRSGSRSASAVSLLRQEGFTEVYNGGGLDNLLEALN